MHHSDKKGWNYSIWFGFFTCISNLKHCGFCDQVLHLCKGDIFCNNNEGSIIVYFTSWHITVTLVVISVYYCAVTSLIQQYIYTKKVRFPLLEQKRNKDYILCMNNIYIKCRRESIGGFQCHYLLYIVHHT